MCGKSTDIEATDIEASEDAVSEQEYALLKAMADADHKVNGTSTSKVILNHTQEQCRASFPDPVMGT